MTRLGEILSTNEVFKTQSTVTTVAFSVSNNTTPAQITNLTSTLVSGSTYFFRFNGVLNAPATPGLKLGIDGTATASAVRAAMFCSVVSTSVILLVNQLTALATSAGAAGNAVFSTIWMEGTITASGNGTFYPTFAQNTSSATACDVLEGALFYVVDIT